MAFSPGPFPCSFEIFTVPRQWPKLVRIPMRPIGGQDNGSPAASPSKTVCSSEPWNTWAPQATDSPPTEERLGIFRQDFFLGLVGDIPALADRSEEHTSELQSLRHLVCRLLLEKKKI